MKDLLGSALAWTVYLGACYKTAKPLAILAAGALIYGLVCVAILRSFGGGDGPDSPAH